MTAKDDEPTFFVSRRGKQVGVHQVDLSGIDIESTDGTPQKQPDQKPKKGKKLAKKVTAGQKKKWTKRKCILLAVVVLVLISPFLVAELVTAEYVRGSENAKKDLNVFIKTDVLPAQKKTKVAPDQLRSFAHNVNEIVGKMCKGGLLDNAATIYPRANEALLECKNTQKQYAALASSLSELEKHANYLSKLDGIMKPVATPITDNYAVLDAQRTTWNTAADDIAKLSPTNAMETSHSDLLTHVKAAATAWATLYAANGSQNPEEFKAAEQTLNNEYDAIRRVSAGFTEVIVGAQNNVTAAYNKIK